MEPTSLTISEAADLIYWRTISPLELTRAHLRRIDQIDPLLNSFITVTTDSALEQARQAEEELKQGKPRGPLHGIPIALKDLYETSGIYTTGGSSFFTDFMPQYDAVVVRKLREAGAVILGKLNMHEIALGVTNENPHFGSCNNPWDVRCVSGGSSGGSAAALSSGLCLGSMGSDSGGSIRIPAALCGVVGLKPTFGRISLRGVMPLSWNLDHAGPMGRNVRDVALLLGAVAGYDPLDPVSVNQPVPDYLVQIEDGVRGWRVALASDLFFTDPSVVDANVQTAIIVAGKVFEDLGAYVEEASFHDANQAARANGLLVTSDAAAYHRERLEHRPQDFGADVLMRLQAGRAYTSTEYVQTRRLQTILTRQFEEFFNKYDILLTPTTPVAAPRRGIADAAGQPRQLTRFTSPFNLTGLPAISIPCGFTLDGLPIGLQIITKSWGEVELLRAAFAYQEATDWHKQIPQLNA
jgi:aspartyl-tRNA(Asn)/glutamyl-tRNA(Gln) amidotransferase subunit A